MDLRDLSVSSMGAVFVGKIRQVSKEIKINEKDKKQFRTTL